MKFLGTRASIGAMTLLILLMVGCTRYTGDPSVDSTSKESPSPVVETVLRKLNDNYEQRRLERFLQQLHPDFASYDSNIRNDLSTIFRVYSGLQLKFFGHRVRSTPGRRKVEVDWRLRWTCQGPSARAPAECQDPSDVGNIIKRRGRTTLVLSYYDGKWLLYDQSGAQIFGSLSPGTVQ